MPNKLPVHLSYDALDEITLANLTQHREVIKHLVDKAQEKHTTTELSRVEKEDWLHNVTLLAAIDLLMEHFQPKC
jgi:hypothetical protein